MMRLKPPLRDPQEEEGKEYGEEDCADDPSTGVVRLEPQAEAMVKQLQRETGMSAKYIVSQIIIQGFDLVEIKEEKEQ